MSMYKTSCKKSYTKKTNEVYAAAVFTVFYFPILFLDKKYNYQTENLFN